MKFPGREECVLADLLERRAEAMPAGRELDAARLIAFLAPRMPRYWLPRFVEFVSELPRTESYKVKKADLRAAGITPGTWDRERAGLTLEREAVR